MNNNLDDLDSICETSAAFHFHGLENHRVFHRSAASPHTQSHFLPNFHSKTPQWFPQCWKSHDFPSQLDVCAANSIVHSHMSPSDYSSVWRFCSTLLPWLQILCLCYAFSQWSAVAAAGQSAVGRWLSGDSITHSHASTLASSPDQLVGGWCRWDVTGKKNAPIQTHVETWTINSLFFIIIPVDGPASAGQTGGQHVYGMSLNSTWNLYGLKERKNNSCNRTLFLTHTHLLAVLT